jgi:hypothetical protein
MNVEWSGSLLINGGYNGNRMYCKVQTSFSIAYTKIDPAYLFTKNVEVEPIGPIGIFWIFMFFFLVTEWLSRTRWRKREEKFLLDFLEKTLEINPIEPECFQINGAHDGG